MDRCNTRQQNVECEMLLFIAILKEVIYKRKCDLADFGVGGITFGLRKG